MYKHVAAKDVRFAELHATLGARVVLVLGMVLLVLVEALNILELLTAYSTRVCTMNLHVSLQDRRLATLHWTLLARVHRLAVMVLDRLCVPQ